METQMNYIRDLKIQQCKIPFLKWSKLILNNYTFSTILNEIVNFRSDNLFCLNEKF